MNQTKERTEKRGLGTTIVDLIGSVIWLFLFIITGFSFLLGEEGEETNFKNLNLTKLTIAAAIILLGFFLWEIYAMTFELERDEKWEKQAQSDIQKATEKLKKELLEIKIEPLLTQNKLREAKEKSIIRN